MGLLKILRKMKQREKEMRVLVLGLDNSGKTTCMKRFNGEDISSISPTLGFNIFSFTYQEFKLTLWDIGGQQTLRSYWRNYFEQTDGIIWVVDSADKIRISMCAQELHTLLKEERLLGASLLVLANKQDIPSALSSQDIEEELKLSKIQNRRWNIVGCSAFSKEGLEDGIRWLVQEISSRIYALE